MAVVSLGSGRAAHVGHRPGHAGGPVGGEERGDLGHVRQARGPPEGGHAGDHLLDLGGVGGAGRDLGELVLGERVGDAGGPDADDPDALRPELGGQVAHERLGGGVGRAGAAHAGHGALARRAVEVEDDAGALLDHPPAGGPGGEEVGPQARVDGSEQVVGGHVDQRGALHVAAGDEVERDVDGPALGRDRGDVVVDGPLVEGVEHGDVRAAAVGGDGGGDLVERAAGPPGEEHAGAVAGHRAGHGAADRSAAAVDDGVPAVQGCAHLVPPSCSVWSVRKVQRRQARGLIALPMNLTGSTDLAIVAPRTRTGGPADER
jgi:hypothetical protein